MLKLVNIKKDYPLKGQEPVHALKGVSINFRRNEFVAILGPSGCGKTTLLNITGGLDRYTSGDLIIEGKSTKKYTDRDWDTYRNHSIGFVFQSYNLISHLNILGNVELALTISGVKKKERRERAMEALDRVGLKGLYKKKPNQLSGGQMQRVAIARALVNDPEIVLADEPTGALDSDTSVQIMDLLKTVANDRLVIMVTHNGELAEQYATRIISFLDGVVSNDTNPYDGLDEEADLAVKKIAAPNKKSKMKLHTAFALSGKNLIAKIKRTALVVAASSIGIIGVSSVLAVSTGVKSYIDDMQNDMLAGNPISIEKTTLDVKNLLTSFSQTTKEEAIKHATKKGVVDVDYMIKFLAEQKDNLETFSINNTIDQNYIDFIDDMPSEYYAAIKKEYGINFKLNMFADVNMTDSTGSKDGQLRTVTLESLEKMYTNLIKEHTAFGDYSSVISLLTNTFYTMPLGEEYIKDQYEFISNPETSYIPKEDNEMMMVVSQDQEARDIFLGQLGYYSQDQFNNLVNKFVNPEGPYKDSDCGPTEFNADDLLTKVRFRYVPYSANYVFKNNPTNNPEMIYSITGNYVDMPLNYNFEATESNPLPAETKDIKITAVVKLKKGHSYGCLDQGLVVSPKMQEMIIEDSKNSEMLTALKNSFETYKTLEKEKKETYALMSSYNYTYFYRDENNVLKSDGVGTDAALAVMNVGGSMGGGAFSGVISKMFGNAYSIENLFESAIRSVGGNPIAESISIYPHSFEKKHMVTDYLDKWNGNEDITLSNGKVIHFHNPDHPTDPNYDREQVTYNDNLELIISLINTMIDIITIALVCFTSLSLVVSTVMIGIITYVSVVERIKEIGIIRSLGGRKLDVANLFNVETFIIGLCSGIFGICVTYGICAIINIVINSFAPLGALVYLPWYFVLIIIAAAIILTLIAGLIPSRAAAKKDPVIALRVE